MISGATYTSQAFSQSLQAAILKAKSLVTSAGTRASST